MNELTNNMYLKQGFKTIMETDEEFIGTRI